MTDHAESFVGRRYVVAVETVPYPNPGLFAVAADTRDPLVAFISHEYCPSVTADVFWVTAMSTTAAYTFFISVFRSLLVDDGVVGARPHRGGSWRARVSLPDESDFVLQIFHISRFVI